MDEYKIPQHYIDELVSMTDLASLMAEELNGRGSMFNCPFPNHQDNTPSLQVFKADQHYYCHGCKEHGNAIHYLRKCRNMTFLQAVTFLAERNGKPLPPRPGEDPDKLKLSRALYGICEAAAQFFEKQLMAPAGKHARAYIGNRGLEAPSVKTFRLGCTPAGSTDLHRYLTKKGFALELQVMAGLVVSNEGRAYDYFRGRLIFPILDQAGRPVAFGGRTLSDHPHKYLNSPETPIYTKGERLYNVQSLRRDGNAPVVANVFEGYMDVIMAAQKGITGAVAPLGTSLTSTQAQFLCRRAGQINVCFDPDAGGERGQELAARNLIQHVKPSTRTRFVTLPGENDPADFFRTRPRALYIDHCVPAGARLHDVIWKACLKEPVDCPEAGAELADSLSAFTSTIIDDQVRAQYDRFYAARIDRLYSAQGKGD